MSDFRAIGGVSATLQTLLMDRMELPEGIAEAKVTIGAPKITKPDEQAKDDPRVNLFLYRVTENGLLANDQIPGQGNPAAYGQPPLALNLHYLLTTYGSEQVPSAGVGAAVGLLDEKLSHFLLGSAMRVLHDIPTITDRLTTIAAPSGRPILHDSLRGEYEEVTLALEPLTLEDITKVWTALTLRYRLSAAYAVHVVRIESRRRPTFPKPVGKPSSIHGPAPGAPPEPGPNIPVVTFRYARIDTVHVRRLSDGTESAFPYAGIGDSLVLIGSGLAGASTDVLIGNLVIPPASVADRRIEVALPDATLPDGPIAPDDLLRPGARTASVIVRDPVVPGSSIRSNEAAFMLVPSITQPPSVVAGAPSRVKIRGARLFVPGASGETLIGRAQVVAADYVQQQDDEIRVPMPDELPRSDIRAVIGTSLPAMVTMSAGSQTIRVTIGGTPLTVRLSLPANVARDAIPQLLEAAVRDAGDRRVRPLRRGFLEARVGLLGDALIVVPGQSMAISVAQDGVSSAAADLGLLGQPAVSNIYLSGVLLPFPVLSHAEARMSTTVAAQTRELSFQRPRTLEQMGVLIEPAIRSAAAIAAFTGTRVAALSDRIAIVPGQGQSISFAPTTADNESVSELQLQAWYGVRVRVNGAESVDDAWVSLP
jgi:hypothetical protein